MGRRQNFAKSVIYHIRHMESNEVVYVGSTTNFSQRKGKHKYDCNNEEGKHFTYPIYCHIRDNGGFDCFEVIPIKSLKLGNKTELLIAEQEEIDKHRTLVNSRKAHMTIEDRKEYDKQYDKQYYQENKENKTLYYQEHKEIIKEERKEYYQENKENINEKQKQPVKCPICNSTVIRVNLKRHQRTKKCQENKENINESIKCPICNSTVTRGSLKRHQRTKKCQEYLNE